MTDVHCNKDECMNNRKGWCTANAIHVSGRCQSYAPLHDIMKSRHTILRKQNGKYKQNKGCLK